MPRYIDAEKLMKKISKEIYCSDTTLGFDGYQTGLGTAYCFVTEQETADVHEVRHGKWERINPFVDTMTCSLCDYNIVSEEMKTPYCPWCGAKMDLEEEAQ